MLPVVAIDGVKIKAIRETKKLTQLYVANVVGVTSDTISRWENNRYPHVRRDNAEKLAAALEVELAEILRQVEPATEVTEAFPTVEKKRGRRYALLILTAGMLLALIVFLVIRQTRVTVTAVRRLPHFGAPGKIIPVQISINRKVPGRKGLIVKERLPAGWRFVKALPPAATGADQEAKWLIPGGDGPVIISYAVQVSPSADMETPASFSGSVVVEASDISRTEAIAGDQAMTVAGFHWADRNGDGRIDDNEIMPAYYLTEEMKGLGLDWREIEAIWSSRGYVWNQTKKEFNVTR